jgi:hypothetical protein
MNSYLVGGNIIITNDVVYKIRRYAQNDVVDMLDFVDQKMLNVGRCLSIVVDHEDVECCQDHACARVRHDGRG